MWNYSDKWDHMFTLFPPTHWLSKWLSGVRLQGFWSPATGMLKPHKQCWKLFCCQILYDMKLSEHAVVYFWSCMQARSNILIRAMLFTQLQQTTSRRAAKTCLLLSVCAAARATRRASWQHWEPQSPRKPSLMKSNRCCESSDTWWNSWKFFRRLLASSQRTCSWCCGWLRNVRIFIKESVTLCDNSIWRASESGHQNLWLFKDTVLQATTL